MHTHVQAHRPNTVAKETMLVKAKNKKVQQQQQSFVLETNSPIYLVFSSIITYPFCQGIHNETTDKAQSLCVCVFVEYGCGSWPLVGRVGGLYACTTVITISKKTTTTAKC